MNGTKVPPTNTAEAVMSQTEPSQNLDHLFSLETIRVKSLKNFIYAFLAEVGALRELQTRHPKLRINLRQEVRRFEMNLISCALYQAGGNQTHAAHMLGVKVSTLNSKIKNYGIPITGLNGFRRSQD